MAQKKYFSQTPSDGNLGWTHELGSSRSSKQKLILPHSSEIVSVVHNGIIENSDLLKKEYLNKGYKFKSSNRHRGNNNNANRYY